MLYLNIFNIIIFYIYLFTHNIFLLQIIVMYVILNCNPESLSPLQTKPLCLKLKITCLSLCVPGNF